MSANVARLVSEMIDDHVAREHIDRMGDDLGDQLAFQLIEANVAELAADLNEANVAKVGFDLIRDSAAESTFQLIEANMVGTIRMSPDIS